MFFVYIIYSATYDIYYKGISADIAKRLDEHNCNQSRYTSGKGPWELVYHEQVDSKKEALIREKQIKKWNRLTIERAINKSLG